MHISTNNRFALPHFRHVASLSPTTGCMTIINMETIRFIREIKMGKCPFKTMQGIKTLTNAEATKIAIDDSDFHRRDTADSTFL